MYSQLPRKVGGIDLMVHKGNTEFFCSQSYPSICHICFSRVKCEQVRSEDNTGKSSDANKFFTWASFACSSQSNR